MSRHARKRPTPPRLFRLGTYDPLNEAEPEELVGPTFDDSPEDRARILEALQELHDGLAGDPSQFLAVGLFTIANGRRRRRSEPPMRESRNEFTRSLAEFRESRGMSTDPVVVRAVGAVIMVIRHKAKRSADG